MLKCDENAKSERVKCFADHENERKRACGENVLNWSSEKLEKCVNEGFSPLRIIIYESSSACHHLKKIIFKPSSVCNNLRVIVCISSSVCHRLNSFFLLLTMVSNRSQHNIHVLCYSSSALSVCTAHSRLPRTTPWFLTWWFHLFYSFNV